MSHSIDLCHDLSNLIKNVFLHVKKQILANKLLPDFLKLCSITGTGTDTYVSYIFVLMIHFLLFAEWWMEYRLYTNVRQTCVMLLWMSSLVDKGDRTKTGADQRLASQFPWGIPVSSFPPIFPLLFCLLDCNLPHQQHNPILNLSQSIISHNWSGVSNIYW